MSKIDEMKRTMYENYNSEELAEYYKRIIIFLKENNAETNQIMYYLNKLKELENNKSNGEQNEK